MRELTQADIVRSMVGRDVHEGLDRAVRPRGRRALAVRGLARGSVVRDVSFDLHAGEVLGLAGLVGSGRTELLRLIDGADRKDAGDVLLGELDDAREDRLAGAGRARRHRLRHRGSQVARPAAAAIDPRQRDAGQPRRGVARRLAAARRRTRPRSSACASCCACAAIPIEQPVDQLSGGNQQKVVFARWLHRDCDVLLLDEPTRGVDIGARADIYAQMDKLAAAGKALLMVSSDLRELMSVCDRIGVMSAGQARAHLRARRVDGAAAAGGRVQRLRRRRETRLTRTDPHELVRNPSPPAAALTSAIGTVAGLLVALALMIGFFSWQSEYFFTADTFITIANDIPAVAVTAVGMTFVLIIAGIDLSVGSTMALAAAVAGIAMLQWHWSLLPATLLAMAVGVVRGRDQRRGDGGLAAAVVHRHAGHAGDGARRGLPRHRLAHAVHRRRDRLAGQAGGGRAVAGVLHRDRDRRAWRRSCSRARCSAAA